MHGRRIHATQLKNKLERRARHDFLRGLRKMQNRLPRARAFRNRFRRRSSLVLMVHWDAWTANPCNSTQKQVGATRPTSFFAGSAKNAKPVAPRTRLWKSLSPACEFGFDGALGCMDGESMQPHSKTSRSDAPGMVFCGVREKCKTGRPANAPWEIAFAGVRIWW